MFQFGTKVINTMNPILFPISFVFGKTISNVQKYDQIIRIRKFIMHSEGLLSKLLLRPISYCNFKVK